MIIYLIRHGESEANISNYHQGQLDTNLTQRGVEQAEKLALRFKDINDFEIIYSSDLKRAHLTAQHIHKFHKDKSLLTDEKLRERDFGEFHGKDKSTHNWDDLEEKNLFLRKPKNAENFFDHKKRVEEFLEKVLEENKNCIIVSHGGTTRILLHLLGQLPKEDFFTTKSKTKNASITKVQITSLGVQMLLENCIKHLEE